MEFHFSWGGMDTVRLEFSDLKSPDAKHAKHLNLTATFAGVQ